MENTKYCSGCNTTKQLTEFHIDSSEKDGHRHQCKVCRNAKQRKYARENKNIIKARNLAKKESRKAYYQSDKGIESSRKAHLKRAFGITLEQYNIMLQEQNGVCDICKQKETSRINNFLSVDHCHTTGIIRGLLCSDCNRGIGLLKDNKENLTNAIKYLENAKYKSLSVN